MRRLPENEAREMVATGSVLFAGGGLAAATVGAIASRWAVEGWNASGLFLAGTGAIVFAGLLRFLPARWVTFGTASALGLLGTLYIGWVQIAYAGPRSFAPMLFTWPILFGFAYLPRAYATLLTVTVLVVLGVIFAVQPGWTTAFAYWIFVAASIFVTAMMVSRLVRRVQVHADREREAREELAALNRTLEQRVESQVDQMGRLDRLRRFLSPSVVDAVLSDSAADVLTPHRREIAAVFCDMRGFTSFAATAEPEEVTTVIERFHAVIGSLVERYGATVGSFAGDGVLLYFNDPVPCNDPAGTAVRFALDLAEPMREAMDGWHRRGFDLGYGVGIALGYATLGLTGFDSRQEYTAIGTVVNLASRLSDEAGRSDILLDPRAWDAVSGSVDTEQLGQLTLKGFSQPVSVYRVLRSAEEPTPAP